MPWGRKHGRRWSQRPRRSRCPYAKPLTVILTGSQLSCSNGGQMICEVTGARTPPVLTQVCISQLLLKGDQDCPCWKLATFMDSGTGRRRRVANKQSKTYLQNLLGTVAIYDAVGLHTHPTAFAWAGLYIFKALREVEGVKSTPAEGNCTIVLGVWLECSYLRTLLNTRQDLTSYFQ